MFAGPLSCQRAYTLGERIAWMVTKMPAYSDNKQTAPEPVHADLSEAVFTALLCWRPIYLRPPVDVF